MSYEMFYWHMDCFIYLVIANWLKSESGLLTIVLFLLFVVPQVPHVYANDSAVIFSSSCDSFDAFGEQSDDQILILRKLGWKTHYFCGRPNQDIHNESSMPYREGFLTVTGIVDGFKSLDAHNGDNILVIFNIHGDIYPLNSLGDQTNPMDDTTRLSTVEAQGLIVYDEISSKKKNMMWANIRSYSQTSHVKIKRARTLYSTKVVMEARAERLFTKRKIFAY